MTLLCGNQISESELHPARLSASSLTEWMSYILGGIAVECEPTDLPALPEG